MCANFITERKKSHFLVGKLFVFVNKIFGDFVKLADSSLESFIVTRAESFVKNIT